MKLFKVLETNLYMSKRPEFQYQADTRRAYYTLFSYVVKQQELEFDGDSYKKVSILANEGAGFKKVKIIVAEIESDATCAEPNDLTNERWVGRKYEGLKISLKKEKYKPKIEHIGKVMGSVIGEEVIIQ